MVSKKHLILFLVLIISMVVNAQQENVPLNHDIYTFLKEMKVKGIVDNIHDDSPNMSRYEIRNILKQIELQTTNLSNTEIKLLKKYQKEFYDDDANNSNTMQMFGSSAGFSTDWSDVFSDKVKHTYAYRRDKVNLYIETLGRAMYGQSFKPIKNNSELLDIGFRMRGTLLNNLGYSMTIQKGGVWGSQDLAPTFDPRLNYNFKFYEQLENVGNYDFTEGYLRYHTEPVDSMSLSFQIGREIIKLGYGYGDRLTLTGNHPYIDFIRTDFSYGILSYTALHGSTIGEFHANRENNYTKFIAYNRFRFKFRNMFDFGIGEVVVYNGRGIDPAYLNPFIFYKFVEMSLQDRDNGLVFLDLQTNFIKNLELQGTFFLDENIIGHLQEMNRFSNKTAYQIGAFWYSPFSINDLSVVFEYTKIRPYVYSHITIKNSYTAHSELLGHRIGPNSDEIHTRLSYNFTEKLRGNFEFQHVRTGKNQYDALGNLVFNAGNDPLIGHREGIDPKHINFLDGDRVNTNIFTISFRFEPIRELYFDFLFKHFQEKDFVHNVTEYSSYAYLKMYFEF